MAGESLLTGFPNVFSALYNWATGTPTPAPQKPAASAKPAPKKVVAPKQAAPVPVPKKKLKPGNVLSAFGSGINEWLPFEFVNRAVAGGYALAGKGDYDSNLELLRAQDEANQEAHPLAYVAGAIPAVYYGGRGLVKGVEGAGNVISKAPGVIGKAGKLITASQNLAKGEKLKNAGKLALGGGAYAGTDEALNGGDASDVLKSSAVGAVASPLASGALKTAGYLGRPLVDLVSQSNYGQILRRITKASMEDLQKARADYVAKTGSEPTLFELLPKGDRDKIGSKIIPTSPEVQDQAAAGIRARAANVEPEMRASVASATGSRSQSIQDALAADLAASRGAPAAEAADTLAAQGATKSTAGAAKFREAEASNIMAPHDNKSAYSSVEEMLPQADFNPITGEQFADDPEAAALIRRAAGSLRLSDNITIKNVTDIQRGLKKMVDRNDVNSDAAQRALNHVDDILERDHPEASEAIQKMRDAYAGRSRMIEGMEEGTRTRTANKFPVNDSSDLNKYRNVYETPEGEAGRAIGQTNKLAEDFSGTPEEAIAATGRLADDTGVQRALGENVSLRTASELSAAAEAQAQGLRNLAELRNKTKGEVPEADLRHLGDALLAFNPGSFAMTRTAALSRLLRMTNLSEKKASVIVDKLFSQNPTKIEEGLKWFDRMGGPGRQFLGDLAHSISLNAAQLGPAAVKPEDVSEQASEPDYAKMSDEELMQVIGQQSQSEPDYSGMSDEELMQAIGQQPQAQASPYAGATEGYGPEFQDLFNRVLRQESGHSQTDAQGNPIQSSAGAIGIAQVMPGTAPQAAELAGLPWDEQAYYTDAHYNKALGAAYLNEMLRTFNGNPALAIAAYNAGPGAVQRAVARGQNNWVAYLPEETQNYLRAIL